MKKIKKIFWLVFAMILVSFFNTKIAVKAEEGAETPVEETLPVVVINPDANGKATYVYDVEVPTGEKDEEGNDKYEIVSKQYTRSRDIKIRINLTETKLAEYDDKFNVCEVIPNTATSSKGERERCSFYTIEKSENNFQIYGPGDGEKELRIYFYEDFYNNQKAEEHFMKINLDTTGPTIILEGSEYMYVAINTTFSDPGVSCNDTSDVKTSKECKVKIQDYQLDYSKEGYQYITYTAVDFLGNESNINRKILIEVATKVEKETDYYWFFAIGLVVVVALALGYIVIKNKEKQKNQSLLS